MPAKSQAQRAYLYATKGKAWVEEHHFDNKGPLPDHAKTKQHVRAALARLRKKKKS